MQSRGHTKYAMYFSASTYFIQLKMQQQTGAPRFTYALGEPGAPGACKTAAQWAIA